MDLYKSIVAYDGTEFQGFQRQAPGVRTVQSVLEQGLQALGWLGPSLKAAGRTDAGVHASGQVIAFQLDWPHAPDHLTAALNAHLPDDVAVRTTVVAPEGFEPRFRALSRRYRYRLLLDAAPDPLRERFAWRIWPEPDLAAMRQASELLVGRHDFGALGRAPIPGGHTLRSVFRADWQVATPEVCLILEADAFLHRMVRRIMALLMEIGRGRTDPDRLRSLLDAPGTPVRGRIAPAHGLCLEAVAYGE
ncbi:MAG TPA: tRNA pseudouridine(38-40) synthase TruA [Anaerolineales bacterium]